MSDFNHNLCYDRDSGGAIQKDFGTPVTVISGPVESHGMGWFWVKNYLGNMVNMVSSDLANLYKGWDGPMRAVMEYSNGYRTASIVVETKKDYLKFWKMWLDNRNIRLIVKGGTVWTAEHWLSDSKIVVLPKDVDCGWVVKVMKKGMDNYLDAGGCNWVSGIAHANVYAVYDNALLAAVRRVLDDLRHVEERKENEQSNP